MILRSKLVTLMRIKPKVTEDENMLLVKMREVTSKKRGVGPNPNVDA